MDGIIGVSSSEKLTGSNCPLTVSVVPILTVYSVSTISKQLTMASISMTAPMQVPKEGERLTESEQAVAVYRNENITVPAPKLGMTWLAFFSAGRSVRTAQHNTLSLPTTQ